MHTFKKLGVLAIAIFALSAVGTASASTPFFTYSSGGQLSGKATETQVWTTAAGQVKCSTADTEGTIGSLDFREQHYRVGYRNCTAFGFATVHISPATYLLTANGSVHFTSTFTITVTGAGCHLTITPQTVGTMSYINEGGSLILTPHLTGIHVDSSGGLCGATSTTATFTGNSTVERVGGGSIGFDA